MHPTPPPDSTGRSRHRRSGRQVFFGAFLPGVCWGCLLVSSGCDRPADATRTTGAVGSTTRPAVDTETEPVTAAANASPIRLDPPALDFGPIQKGSTAEATVRLINTSGRPLRILQAKTSCGCTVAEVSKDPFDPGESIEVTVRFKPGGKVGARSTKTVRFILEGDFEPIPLSVTGRVAQFVTIEPERLDSPIAEDRTIVLRSTDGQPFRVLGATPPILTVNSQAGQEQQLEQQLVVSAQQWADQNSPRRVEIKLDHPVVTSIFLTISRPRRSSAAGTTARSAGGSRSTATQLRSAPGAVPLQLVPRRLSFGRLDAKKGAVRTVLIRGARVIEGVEPRVSIDSELARVEVVGVEQTSGGLRVTVRLVPRPEQSGTLQGTLYVSYDGAQGGAELYGSIDRSKGLESQASSGDPR